MTTELLAAAADALAEGVDALRAGSGAAAGAAELLSGLTICEGATRRIDQLAVGMVAALERRGAFVERGYRNAAEALSDLLGWDRPEARRRVLVAEQVCERIGIGGQVQPPRLPATAAGFAAGRMGLRHVEVLVRALGTPAARRLTSQVWGGAEAELAEKATQYRPQELAAYAQRLIDSLDEDGPAPDDDEPRPVNELYLTPNSGAPGGRISGRFDDAAVFDAVATAVDALSAPTDGDDLRTTLQRQAEALAELCAHALDEGRVPQRGGERPHLNVIIRLEDLENRARSAVLDFGGAMSPEALRMLACDARVVPIVMNGKGQPLDVGRIKRTIPDGLRRAVAARDRGCAFPGCGRRASWCEVHHIVPWEQDGETTLDNCVMLCRVHHRLLHHPGWTVRIRDGLPEFIPPKWICPQQVPRRKPVLLAA
jgi:hypothetical protein